jgi:hypothetical protein
MVVGDADVVWAKTVGSPTIFQRPPLARLKQRSGSGSGTQ